MLSCDHCNDWFHYVCIGLQPPGDNEDDDEVAPAEYRCPKCCIQVCICCSSLQVCIGHCAVFSQHQNYCLTVAFIILAVLQWMRMMKRL